MNTVEKGNRLEDALYDYLEEQQAAGKLIHGVYSPDRCKIYRQKGYYCAERKRDIIFDVVIEIFREGAECAHLYVIFECKNHKNALSENNITDFSDKLARIGRHNTKGIVVSSSRLKSGAQNLAENRGLGIVKYDKSGFDVIAERKGGFNPSVNFVKSQIFETRRASKSLKFSGFFDGNYFGAVNQFLASLDPDNPVSFSAGERVPYVSENDLRERARQLLDNINYHGGAVDLEPICEVLAVSLNITDEIHRDVDNKSILGHANFSDRSIKINYHENKHRERFTIAHEISHFALKHDRYLSAESVIKSDLLSVDLKKSEFDYYRLEAQANILASELLLPQEEFNDKVAELRDAFDIRDRGHGYIFVDDQPHNFFAYSQLLSELRTYFEVSKSAIELRLRLQGMLTDKRRYGNWNKVR